MSRSTSSDPLPDISENAGTRTGQLPASLAMPKSRPHRRSSVHVRRSHHVASTPSSHAWILKVGVALLVAVVISHYMLRYARCLRLLSAPGGRDLHEAAKGTGLPLNVSRRLAARQSSLDDTPINTGNVLAPNIRSDICRDAVHQEAANVLGLVSGPGTTSATLLWSLVGNNPQGAYKAARVVGGSFVVIFGALYVWLLVHACRALVSYQLQGNSTLPSTTPTSDKNATLLISAAIAVGAAAAAAAVVIAVAMVVHMYYHFGPNLCGSTCRKAKKNHALNGDVEASPGADEETALSTTAELID